MELQVTIPDDEIQKQVRAHIKKLLPSIVRAARLSMSHEKSIADTAIEVYALRYCAAHNANLKDILSKSRKENVKNHRHILKYILYKVHEFTPAEIGDYFKQDRSVLYTAMQFVEDNMRVYPAWRHRVQKAIEATQ
jgi:chromosomal replication initiation ATPase DnaA